MQDIKKGGLTKATFQSKFKIYYKFKITYCKITPAFPMFPEA